MNRKKKHMCNTTLKGFSRGRVLGRHMLGKYSTMRLRPNPERSIFLGDITTKYSYRIKKKTPGSMRWLSRSKPEDLSSIPGTHRKSDVVAHVCNSCTPTVRWGEGGRRVSWKLSGHLAWSTQNSRRNPLSEPRWEVRTDPRRLFSNLHMYTMGHRDSLTQ